MLEKERFLEVKDFAGKVRKENAKLFKSLEKSNRDDAIKEKNEFLESIIDEKAKEFSDGSRGKEEKQIFRANVLIPDDAEFYESYTNDKNIRNLMDKYKVSIEDIMGKITELNIKLFFKLNKIYFTLIKKHFNYLAKFYFHHYNHHYHFYSFYLIYY